MVIVNYKQKVLCVFMSIFNTGISALQFLILISLSRQTIEIYSKMSAFLAYASIVPLGIIELSFVIFIFSYYFKFPDMLSIFRKFLAVTGIQCLVFTLIVIIRLVVFSPYARISQMPITVLMRSWDYIQFFAGLAVGILLIIIPSRWRRC